jgi:phosphatidylglycerol:prolipoprotein diacylglycerol transferase
VTFVIPFPAIDPVAIEIGPLAIRWYGLAWVAGLLLGWQYCLRLTARSPERIARAQIHDFLFWAVISVIVGGRLGYVLFYRPGFYLTNPLEIFAVWHGGMSFHGGFLGVIVAIVLFTRRRGIGLMGFSDIIAAATPVGLFLGRMANFINGELFGRPTDVPWAMVFPRAGPEPRHPSQLYEAGLEGLALFAVCWVLVYRARGLERPGLVSGAFFTGYGLARIFAELFRAPDLHLGFLIGGATMGQLLSLPLLAAGLYLVVRALRPTA